LKDVVSQNYTGASIGVQLGKEREWKSDDTVLGRNPQQRARFRDKYLRNLYVVEDIARWKNCPLDERLSINEYIRLTDPVFDKELTNGHNKTIQRQVDAVVKNSVPEGFVFPDQDSYDSPAPTAATPTIEPTVPNITIGEEYSSVRQKLIDSGWSPAPVATMNKYEIIGHLAKIIREKGFQEVQDCAGTGLAPCSFLFLNKYGNQFEVSTAGQVKLEETPEKLKVSRWGESPVSASDTKAPDNPAIANTPPLLPPALADLTPEQRSFWCDQTLRGAYAANDQSQKDYGTIVPTDMSALDVPAARQNIREYTAGVIAYERAGCGQQTRNLNVSSAEEMNADWGDDGSMEREIEARAQEILNTPASDPD
jgi:hypothetical protein